MSVPRLLAAQVTRSGAKEYGRNRAYELRVGAAKTAIAGAESSRPATKCRPTSDNRSASEANALSPERVVQERLVKVPAGREEVRERGPAHEGGEQTAPAADRLHRAAEDDHRVRRGESLQRAERELDLARPPLVLDRARRHADFPERIPNGLERVADAVEPDVGQELVAPLEDLDLGRRSRLSLPHLLEPDLGMIEPSDVELDLESGHVAVARLPQPCELPAQLRPSVEGTGPPLEK